MLRAVASRRPTASSAAEVMFDVGALTTMTPARVAVCTSTLSRPTPARAMTLRRRPAAIASASILVADRMRTASTSARAGSSASRSDPSTERTSKSGPSASIVAGDRSSAMRTTGLLTRDPLGRDGAACPWRGREPTGHPGVPRASLGTASCVGTGCNQNVNGRVHERRCPTEWMRLPGSRTPGAACCFPAAGRGASMRPRRPLPTASVGGMRVVVTGGAGDLGARVVRGLAGRGVEVVSASRRTGVDLSTGLGLDAVLADTDTVVHCADDTSAGDAVTVYGTRRLADATADRGIHLVHVSIVGVDDHPLPYYRRKLRAEQGITAADGPSTVLRATQFHSLAAYFARSLTRGPVTFTVGDMAFQPVDTDFVAARLAELATGPRPAAY